MSERHHMANPNATLFYREKTQAGDSYQLCFKIGYDNGRDDRKPRINPNGFQWGYKLYGPDYNLNEHNFTYADMTLKTN